MKTFISYETSRRHIHCISHHLEIYLRSKIRCDDVKLRILLYSNITLEHSDGGMVRTPYRKPPGCGFKSGSISLCLWDLFFLGRSESLVQSIYVSDVMKSLNNLTQS